MFVIVIFVWLFKFNNLVWDEVGTSSGVVCANLRSEHKIRDCLICQCLTLFVPHSDMSALCLNRTEGGWAKGIGWEGVSGAVVKIVMN